MPRSWSRRHVLALASALVAKLPQHRAEAAVVPVRRPSGEAGPATSPFTHRLPPPSEPFPASTVQGPITRFTPSTFAGEAFRAALARGGTIELAAGVYDLTGWSLVPLANVRLVGAGKALTVLQTSTPYGGAWADRSAFGNFGLLRGRVEVENLSFVNLKNVFVLHVRGAVEISHTPDLGPTCRHANRLGNSPSCFTAGLAIRDCRFVACRRPVFGSAKGGEERPRNFWMYGCDVERCWVGGMSLATGRVSNVFMYDCHVRDTVLERDLSARNAAAQNALTMEWGVNSSGGHADWTADNLRIESCTFDGSAYLGPVEVRRRDDRHRVAWPRGSVVRLMGVGDSCWIRNTRFRRIGQLSDGRMTSAAHNAYPVYYKGNSLLFENCVFEDVCGTCVISAKGDDPAPLRHPSGPILRNVLFRNNMKHLPQPSFYGKHGGMIDLPPVSLNMIGVLGENRLGDTQLINVSFEDMETENGLIYTYKTPGDGGATGHWQLRNVTFENFRVSAEDCLLRFSHDLETLQVEGVRIDNVILQGLRWALICLEKSATGARTRLRGVHVQGMPAGYGPVEFDLLGGAELPSTWTSTGSVSGATVPVGAETASWIDGVGCAAR